MPEAPPQRSWSAFSARTHRSLGFRLFLLLFTTMAVLFAVHAVVITRATADQFAEFAGMSATRASDLILQSTHYHMLLNRKEDVHQIIRMVARTPGVLGVRIYDKKGTIIFSADEQEIGRRVDLQADACLICHSGAEPLHSIANVERTRVYRGADGRRILGLITPIDNASECSSAVCHSHPPDRTILGVLDVMMTLAPADAMMRASTRELILATLLLATAVGGVSFLFIDRVVRRPVRHLTAGALRIARGELGAQIEVESRDEIGELAEAFNGMSSDLLRANEELRRWSETLEEKVVAKTEEVGRAHRHLLRVERMASLGQLSTTVAHELNNPLSGILTYAKLAARDLDTEVPDPKARGEMARILGFIQREAARCGNIVRNLLVFARASGGAMKEQALGPILERALMVLRHHFEMKRVSLVFEPPEGNDRMFCDEEQIQQALVALMVNAVEAMPGGGTLTLRAIAAEDSVTLQVEDTGVGISPETLPHIFEPFFTTKHGESGVGLGLSVVFGIVERHSGRIDAVSDPGKGTRITMRFPRTQPGTTSAGGAAAAAEIRT